MPHQAARLTPSNDAIARFETVWIVVASAMLLALIGGCRICGSCEDADYPAYGGSWQRTNRTAGRVGSVFDPGGARGSLLSERDQPTDIDAAERDGERGNSFDGDDESDLDGAMDSNRSPEVPNDLKDSPLPSLEDIEDERSNRLRDLELDDIEVKLIRPRGGPRV